MITAIVTPWSSVVGVSVGLTDETGRNIGQLAVRNAALISDIEDQAKDRMIALAEQVAATINEADPLAERVRVLEAALRKIDKACPERSTVMLSTADFVLLGVGRRARFALTGASDV